VEVTVRENYTYPKISLSRGVVLSQITFQLLYLLNELTFKFEFVCVCMGTYAQLAWY